MTVTLHLDEAALSAFTSHDSELYRQMFSAGEQIRVLAQSEIHRVTGRLAESIHTDVQVSDGTIVVEVGTDVGYALFVHDGTVPHDIIPVRARALRFVSQGKVVFAQRVHHPGTKPNPYLTGPLQVIAARVLGTEADLTRS